MEKYDIEGTRDYIEGTRDLLDQELCINDFRELLIKALDALSDIKFHVNIHEDGYDTIGYIAEKLATVKPVKPFKPS